MKELVSHWISNLAVIAILAALVDMVLPDGNFRKYTGFIFGLLILILILQPLLLLVREIPNLDIRVIKNTANHQKQVLSIHELQGKVNKEKELERLLREKLEKKLALELEQRKGIISPKITIMFSKKNGKIDFSNIYKIDINCYVKDEKTLINPIVELKLP
jgi:stage III sporulation protein AF